MVVCVQQQHWLLPTQAVQDAAQGAMVLLSEATHEHCSVEELRQQGVQIAHMGQHVLKGLAHPVHLYAPITLSLMVLRFASLGPVRCNSLHAS
jgi:class 3 adenylate cyclase